MDNDTKGGILLLVIFLIIICSGAWVIGHISCNNKWPNIRHEYGFFTGCMIDPNGKGLIPEHNYRVL